MHRMMLTLLALVFALILLSAIVLVAAISNHPYFSWSDGEASVSMKYGDGVILLIDDYKNKNNTYPKLLTDLGVQIKNPSTGNGEWIYWSDRDQYYVLKFSNSDGYPSCYYDSRSQKWIVKK